jgi:hypothetical protein
MAFLVQEKSELGVSAVAKLKEHHIMCAEELARNQSVRKIASTFDVDESTSRPDQDQRRLPELREADGIHAGPAPCQHPAGQGQGRKARRGEPVQAKQKAEVPVLRGPCHRLTRLPDHGPAAPSLPRGRCGQQQLQALGDGAKNPDGSAKGGVTETGKTTHRVQGFRKWVSLDT